MLGGEQMGVLDSEKRCEKQGTTRRSGAAGCGGKGSNVLKKESGVQQAGNTGQLLAFHELQGGAAAGGDVSHLVGVAQLLHSGCAVTAADDGDGVGLAEGFCHGFGALGESGELKHAHGAVPDDGAGILHGVAGFDSLLRIEQHKIPLGARELELEQQHGLR